MAKHMFDTIGKFHGVPGESVDELFRDCSDAEIEEIKNTARRTSLYTFDVTENGNERITLDPWNQQKISHLQQYCDSMDSEMETMCELYAATITRLNKQKYCHLFIAVCILCVLFMMISAFACPFLRAELMRLGGEIWWEIIKISSGLI